MELRPEVEAVETVTLSIVDVVVTSLEVEVMKAVVAVILSLEVVVIMSQEAVAASNLVTTIINHAAEVKEVVMSPEVVVTLNLEEEVVTKAEAEAMSLEIVDVVDTIMITKIDLLVNKDLNAVDMVSNTDPTTKLLLLSQLSRVDLEVEEAVAEEELSQEASKKSPLLLKLKLKTLTVMETTNQNQNNMANTLSSNLVIIKTMAETNSDPNKTTSPIEMTTTSLANITKTTSAITNIKEVGTEVEDVVETSSLETIEAVITILLDKDTVVVTKKMANINPRVMAVEEAITIEEATNLVVGSKIEAVESADLSEDTAAVTKREVAINLVVDTEVIEETSEEVTTSMEKEVTVVASIMREEPQEAVEMEAISKRTTKAARKITSKKVAQTMKKRNTEDEE